MAALDLTAVHALTDEASLKACAPPGGKVALLFVADWDEPSQQLAELLAESARAKAYEGVALATADAEACDALADAFSVEAVPTLVLLENGAAASTSEAPTAAQVADALQAFAARSALPPPPDEAAAVAATALDLRLKQLVRAAPAMLFMKGSPETPRCGFSRQICELLNGQSVPFASFDILTDPDVRAGLKKFSDWPTYPQLYANGELVGGLDIVKEMAAEGDLLEQLALEAPEVTETPADAEARAKEELDARLKALTTSAKCMLFMKGSPGNERCGFSRTICGLLAEHAVPFDSFDILTDDAVRQGLKAFSDWPTYPQFYVDGELIGGLDILQEMAAGGDLKAELGLA